MTVPTNYVKQFANGNGVTTVFFFTFRLLLTTDMQVYVDNTLVAPSQYTVSINSNGIGGSVTFTSAPDSGANNVLLYRFVDYLQETHFPNESDFNQVTLEDSVDKLTMETQQLQEQISRCIVFPVTDPDIPLLSLPDPAPNQAIGWDPSGTFLVDLPLTGILGATGATGATGVTGATGPAGSQLDMIILEDQRAPGTNAGTVASSTWTRLNINTKVLDTSSACTLAGNQFTLPAGTYRMRASSCGNNSNGHQIRLRNITDSTTALIGTQAWNNNTSALQGYAATPSMIDGQFTIADTKVFEIQIIVAHNFTNNLNPGINVGIAEQSVFTRVVIEYGGSGPQGPTGPAGGISQSVSWALVESDGSLTPSSINHNIASTIRNSTGVYTITFTTPYTSAISYVSSGVSTESAYIPIIAVPLAGSCQINFIARATGAFTDTAFQFLAIGI
jgi:hypothetical protein